jgi:rod shape-determining protein MreC
MTKFITTFAKEITEYMNNLIRFLKRYYFIFLFLLLEGVAIYLISQNSYHQGSVIVNVANNISGSVYEKCNNITKYFYLASVNEALTKENALLRSQIENSYVKYTEKEMQIEDTVYKQRFTFIEATVISKTINKRNNYFMLNKGMSNGVLKDMCVITPNGLLGLVVNATSNFSLVMTVLHQDTKIAVKNKRTQATGTMVWEGDDYRLGQVKEMPSSIPIKKGDTLITSGYSRNYPEGIEVGYVKNFKKDPSSGFYNIEFEFSADYNKLEYVYVVRNLFKVEQDILEKSIKDNE